MPISGYFDQVFANAGSKVTVPDTVQPDGSVSYPAGYGVYYTQDPAIDPGTALNIEETKFNQILYDITLALQLYQQNGIPPFIDSTMNGGSPYSYPKGTVVLYGGVPYQSIAAANTDTPPSANWQVFDLSLVALLAAANAFAGNNTFAGTNSMTGGGLFQLGASSTASTQAVGDSSSKLANTAFCNPLVSLTSTTAVVKFSNGLVLMMATGTATVATGTVNSLPATFPTDAIGAVCINKGVSVAPIAVACQVTSTSQITLVCASSSIAVTYIALGY